MGTKQEKIEKMPTPSEIKTIIMTVQSKINEFRNEKLEIIKKKKFEIISCLEEKNLNASKAKMDGLIRQEDYIEVCDILNPLLEILSERVNYILTSIECPCDLRPPLDSIIYASIRLEVEELLKLRDLILKKYGRSYIEKAEKNRDYLVNIVLVEKLSLNFCSDIYLIIRLKQFCIEKKIQFEFPDDISSNIAIDNNNIFINNLKFQINDLREKNNILNNKLNNQIKKNNELFLENSILKKKIEELNKIINNLNNTTNNSKNIQSPSEMNKLYKKIEELEEKLKRYPIILEKNENLMSIIFQSIDQEIKYSMICKNTDTINRLEEKLYEVFPIFSEKENFFLCKGKKLNKFKTFDFNNIKNGDIIILNQVE